MCKNTAILMSGILLGAAATVAIGVAVNPAAERKARHIKRNMCRAAHVVGDAAHDIGRMSW